jgi:ketosteroid isomerase-like protein
MNEEQNTALVRKLYDAFARGDIQTILGNLTGGVEWIQDGPTVIP